MSIEKLELARISMHQLTQGSAKVIRDHVFACGV